MMYLKFVVPEKYRPHNLATVWGKIVSLGRRSPPSEKKEKRSLE